MTSIINALKFIAGTLILLFIILIFNQVVALYNNLDTVNHVLAIVLTLLVAVIFLSILVIPIISFMRYPKMQELPKDVEGQAYNDYLCKQLTKLKTNKTLNAIGYTFEGETDAQKIDLAYNKLKELTFERIKADANAVFITTAISQNGVFDGVTVFVALTKMIYTITTTYENRPTLTRMLYLYAQIASVVLIASTLEDLDLIEEQLEPVLTSLLGGSVISVVPGAANITALAVNSVVEGSVNALLTLRVGIITQRYLSATTYIDKKSLRRGTALEASKHLGEIIGDNAKFILKSFTQATKKATIDKLKFPWQKHEV